MTDYFIKKLTALFAEGLDEDDRAIVEYGITATVLNLPKTIFVILVGKKIGLLKPVLLMFLFISFIRNYSRGIHARTPFACFAVGTGIYLGAAYMSKVLTIPKRIYNAIFAYCFLVYAKYSPSGTEVNPVYRDQIKPLKIRSLLCITIYYVIGTFTAGVVRNIAALSAVVQTISILPITYKLAGQKGGVVHEEE